MNEFIIRTDAWVLALMLSIGMVAACYMGWLIGRSQGRSDGGASDFKFDDVSLALLGLLLAFTFSMSLGKHDQRRIMAVSDSNAIGDFYTCASLIQEPMCKELQTVIYRYAKHRYELAEKKLDNAGLEKALSEIQSMQDQMTALVGKTLDAGTPIAVPLTNTLNDVTSMHASRLAAVRDRLPGMIVVMLFAASIFSAMLMGRQQGAWGKPQIAATLCFILLVSFVVYVTLDLNQPSRGLISVSNESFERLISSMEK